MDTLGDRIYARAGQALLNKLDDGFLENVLAGLFRVVLAALARRSGRGGKLGSQGHGVLTALGAGGDYGPRRTPKEAPAPYNLAWRAAPLRDLAMAARRTATLAAP